MRRKGTVDDAAARRGKKQSGIYTRVAPALATPNTARGMRRSRAEDGDDEENDLALLVRTVR